MAFLKSTKKFNSSMLCSAVIFVVFTSSFLSVNAILCHQCNSHVEEDCNELRLSTPRAPIDNQFLKECGGDHPELAFCRKVTFRIDVTKEHRVIRECGHLNDRVDRNSTCFDADNEGFKQTICACFEDGCNSAPIAQQVNINLAIGLICLSAFLGSPLLRRFT